MDVRVELFARARELAGTNELTVALPAGATVGELRRVLGERCPALQPWLPRCAIGVNGEYQSDEAVLPADAEITVLPPVSGG